MGKRIKKERVEEVRNSSEELLPCGKCGTAPALFKKNRGAFAYKCPNCISVTESTSARDSELEARKIWNRCVKMLITRRSRGQY